MVLLHFVLRGDRVLAHYTQKEDADAAIRAYVASGVKGPFSIVSCTKEFHEKYLEALNPFTEEELS